MKPSKIFSPLSFAMLIVAVLGGGCLGVDEPVGPVLTQKSAKSGIPMLDITSPSLITTTTKDKIEISGTTDQEMVYILNTPIKTPSGAFSSMVVLDKGTHMVPVSAGNGLTTTTISIQITRE